MFSLALPLSLHPQRTLNSNNAYTEDGALYRSGFGESTVSLDSTLRSAKSRSSYLAYVLRYNTLTDCMAASATLLHVCVCVFSSGSLNFYLLCCVTGSQILTHPWPHTRQTLSPAWQSLYLCDICDISCFLPHVYAATNWNCTVQLLYLHERPC